MGNSIRKDKAIRELLNNDAPITCANHPCGRTTLDPDHDGWTCETCPPCTRELDAQHAREEAADAEMRRDKTE